MKTINSSCKSGRTKHAQERSLTKKKIALAVLRRIKQQPVRNQHCSGRALRHVFASRAVNIALKPQAPLLCDDVRIHKVGVGQLHTHSPQDIRAFGPHCCGCAVAPANPAFSSFLLCRTYP